VQPTHGPHVVGVGWQNWSRDPVVLWILCPSCTSMCKVCRRKAPLHSQFSNVLLLLLLLLQPLQVCDRGVCGPVSCADHVCSRTHHPHPQVTPFYFSQGTPTFLHVCWCLEQGDKSHLSILQVAACHGVQTVRRDEVQVPLLHDQRYRGREAHGGAHDQFQAVPS